MGLLDPKLDHERTIELLRKQGATSAVLHFEGGHDEGNVQSITLILEDGSERDMPTWYCGGYFLEQNADGGRDEIPLSQPANEDEELADLLEGPINARFGSWGDVPSTCGTLTWDVGEGTVQFDFVQETYERHTFEEMV
jgi:hypothetical protein